MPVLWHDLLISALPWRVTLSSSCTWLIFRHSKCSSYACTAFGRSLSIPPFQRSRLCKPWNPTARTGQKTCKEQSCSKLPWLSSMLLFGAAGAMLCIVGIDKDLWSMISPDGCKCIYIYTCVCVCLFWCFNSIQTSNVKWRSSRKIVGGVPSFDASQQGSLCFLGGLSHTRMSPVCLTI